MSNTDKSTNSKRFNILLVGGSGLWSEANHIPNLLGIKVHTPTVHVGAICDIQDPYDYSADKRSNLNKLLKIDKPVWVPVQTNIKDVLAELTRLHRQKPFDLVIIASSPVTHMDYALWALENGISVVGDKPVIVSKNASSDPNAAKLILENYKKLCQAYDEAKKLKPYLSFSLILRRRSLPAFNYIAERLSLVSKQHDAGLNHLNILNHGGIYRYPNEMIGEGAHDFTSGVGALSHSSYHYIDLFNWYLRLAQGDIRYIRPRLTSVTRIKDYIDAAGYKAIKNINKHQITEMAELAPEVLAAELDFSFNLQFFDKNKKLIGDGNFISNHLSFTPRTHAENEHDKVVASYRDLGRISHLYIDIHQSGLQNLQLIKNDVMGTKPNIFVQSRAHAGIKGVADYERLEFDNAYSATDYTLQDMLEMVIKANMEKRVLGDDLIIDLKEDARNIVLFSKFYELIANDYNSRTDNYADDYIKLP